MATLASISITPRPQQPSRFAEEAEHLVGDIAGALRRLERAASMRRAPDSEDVALIARMDRLLSPQAKLYVAVVYAAHKESKAELAATLAHYGLTPSESLRVVCAHLSETNGLDWSAPVPRCEATAPPAARAREALLSLRHQIIRSLLH